MVKIMAVIIRRENLTREQFLGHWNNEHPVFVWRLPGLRRYRQNVAIEHRKQWPADGIAELWFDSVKDVAIAFDSPAAEKLFQHESQFIGKMDWLIAEEVEVPQPADLQPERRREKSDR